MAHPPKAPKWVLELVDLVIENLDPCDELGAAGFQYEAATDGDPGLVRVFPTPTEFLGGANDGGTFTTGFEFKISEIAELFEEYPVITFISPTTWGDSDFDGPCITFFGTYRGEELTLSIFSEAPEYVDPTLKLNALTGETVECLDYDEDELAHQPDLVDETDVDADDFEELP